MHRRLTVLLSGLTISAVFASLAWADVTLPCIFSDHMVLQRDKPVAVWGWADKDEPVEVAIAGQSKQARAGEGGRWSVEIGPLAAGGPLELAVKGKNTVVIKDVLVGEVWLCSGQSNMAMTVASAADVEAETAAATHPGIRMITIVRQASEDPEERCEGQWLLCSPETVGGFSATAYYFGRELHKELGVPIGLVTAAWGGTAIEAWTSIEAQQKVAELAPILSPWPEKIAAYKADVAKARYEKALADWQVKAKQAKAEGKTPPRRPAPPVDPRLDQNRPANLFNGMIEPLVPYGIRGAIWYQGERNSHGEPSALYGLQLATLIGDWRARFRQDDFPFLFVQLPNYLKPQVEPSEPTGWVMVREGMLKTLAVNNTGMAVTIDVGDAGNIHPKNKQAVGRRLALWGLATVYGRQIPFSGPLYRGMTEKDIAITVHFDHAGEGLKTADGGPVKGFAVAGTNRKFIWAEGKIEGDAIVVSSRLVARPLAVRYGWANNPQVNLVNSAGLPASPFRTDHWIEPIADR